MPVYFPASVRRRSWVHKGASRDNDDGSSVPAGRKPLVSDYVPRYTNCGKHAVCRVVEEFRGRGGAMTVLSALLGRPRGRAKTPDPAYMETARFDGRRSVDRKKFIDDPRVREQVRELAESVPKP